MSDIVQIDKARLQRIRAAVGAGRLEDVPPPDDRDAPPLEIADESPIEVIDMQGPEIKYRAPDLADVIARLSALPWIPLRLGESVVANARAGMVVALMGPTGSCKSTMAIQIAGYHARHVGPVVYVSLELDADVVAARDVCQSLGVSWSGVLTLTECSSADVTRVLAELHRMIVLDGDRATLAHAERAITTLRAEYPDQPVLVVIDYLQIMQSEGREERVRIAQIAEAIRRMAQRLGVVVLAVSQTSRAAAKGLRDGEVVGVDTTTTGAESAQIERMASVTLAIGSLVEREDGTLSADISTGKARMGGGDRVQPAIIDGRTGRVSLSGPAVSGAERRAERTSERGDARVRGARQAIAAELVAAKAPMTRGELREALGLRRDDVVAAVRDLLRDGEAVEVRGRRAGGHWPIWTRDRADAAGVDIVPPAAGGDR